MKKKLTRIFSCPSYAPFWSRVPLKTFENLVCKISQKVFELEPSCLVYWLGLKVSFEDFPSDFDKITPL